MRDESEERPPAEPLEPTPSPVEEPPAAPQPEPGDDAPTAPVMPPDAAQKRIDRLVRENYEYKRQLEQQRQRWDEIQRQQQQAALPPGQVDARAQARAEIHQEDLVRRFNESCDNLYAKGKAEYGQEMDDAVAAMRAVGWGDRPDALAAITQLPDGHRVYRELAANLDNAARVLSLPPMAMAMELASMARGAQAGSNDNGTGGAADNDNGATRAPQPIRPITGGTARGREAPLDKVSMAEFIRRRDRDERRSRISR